MNITEFANLKVFYNFHFLHFSVGHVLMIASPTERRFKVYMRSNVRGFDSSSSKEARELARNGPNEV